MVIDSKAILYLLPLKLGKIVRNIAKVPNGSITTKYKIKDFTKGIIISKVITSSKAYKSGLRAGMVIVRVGQSEVSDLSVISNAIEKAKKQKRNALLMLVNFEGTDRFVAVEIF